MNTIQLCIYTFACFLTGWYACRATFGDGSLIRHKVPDNLRHPREDAEHLWCFRWDGWRSYTEEQDEVAVNRAARLISAGAGPSMPTKFVTRLILVLLVAVSLFAFTGCSSQPRPQRGGKVNISEGTLNLNQNDNPATPSRVTTTRQIETLLPRSTAPVGVTLPESVQFVPQEELVLHRETFTTTTEIGSSQDFAKIVNAAQNSWKRIAMTGVGFLFFVGAFISWSYGWRPVIPALLVLGGVVVIYTASIWWGLGVIALCIGVYFGYNALNKTAQVTTGLRT